MKQVHIISGLWTQEQVDFLAAFGITVVPEQSSKIQVDPVTFEKIRSTVVVSPNYAIFLALFDRKDLDNASWLTLTDLRAVGYPQPEISWSYEDVYDMENSCPSCKVPRGQQVRPFRVKTDKNRLELFQLEWVNDEIFSSIRSYEQVFGPLGIESLPVIINRSGMESDKIVQLKMPICDWTFDMDGVLTEKCPICSREKYLVRPTNYLPPLAGKPPAEIFFGNEWFGSGGMVTRRVYVSQDLRQTLLGRKLVKWYQFYPLTNT